uniref:Xylulose kinase-1 n=1 Tax=Tanacetum cinerariifolium TaxID=118510 RepID=A0A6L2L0K8_TANCI|nr:hypothetical protein [Tanacetum cinerariifolium]
MIAYLTKSDASEGFNQIIDFLNGSSIKYALTINPNIYVSCIKQFWTSVAVKKVNDVTRLQALVDKEKVKITEATLRDALRLDDAEGIECLPNEEIFAELERMGYEKPSTKLTFYKAFFSSQLKFLIHTILQCMSGKRTSWNEFSSSMASAIICLSTSRKFNFSMYIFNSLVRNVISPTKFYMYPRFLQLMIRKQVSDLSSHTTKYSSPNPDPKSDVSAGDDVVPTVVEEPSIPSPTPPTLPPQPSQDQPSTSQKLERRNKASKLQRLKKVGTAQRIKTSDDTVMDDVSKQGRMIADMDVDVDIILEDAKEVVSADVDESADVQGRKAPAELQEVVEVVTIAKLITEVVTAASATITAAAPQLTTAAAPTLTTAPSAARRRKGVVIRDPEETATLSTIIHSKAKSKDKGKGILVEEPKPLKKQAQIKQDEAYARELEAELNKNIDWDEVIDHVQRKQKEDNAIEYFKGMTYDDIRPIFKKYFNSNVAFLLKTKERVDRALKRLSESQEDKAAKKQKLDEEVEELRRHL